MRAVLRNSCINGNKNETIVVIYFFNLEVPHRENKLIICARAIFEINSTLSKNG